MEGKEEGRAGWMTMKEGGGEHNPAGEATLSIPHYSSDHHHHYYYYY